MTQKKRLIVTGAAGLIGQNLVARLKERGNYEIIGLDKHTRNTEIFRQLNPDIEMIEADLAEPGPWMEVFRPGDGLVLSHAQIGGLYEKPFTDNNVTATANVLDVAKRAGIDYMVHLSSSVVNSTARDFYTESKKAQEKVVLESGIPACILRPTLMFGWFDRKHLGWLARFMSKSPIFPVPGDGKYIRQPLYAGDFCDVIISAVETPKPREIHNISGKDKVYYVDLIRSVKDAARARTNIVNIPYGLFWGLLKTYAVLDRDPPFTTKQLEALVAPDEFEVIDWPAIFGVKATGLDEALKETFRHPVYSKVSLEF
jgi:nucleoside-diphosphate-sugar epimerase